MVLPPCQHLPKRFNGVPDVPVADIERGKAEPEEVGFAEVPDDPPGDKGLHDRIALRVSEGDLASPLGRVWRAHRLDTELPEPLVGETQEEISERRALFPERDHLDSVERPQSLFQRDHRHDSRGPGEKAPHSGRRPVTCLELEGAAVTHPAGKGRLQSLLEFARHVEKTGGAGAAVQVLVAAAHRVFDPVLVQLEGESSGAVAQVPNDGNAGRPGGRGQAAEVVLLARPEVHLGQRGDGHLGPERRLEILRGDQPEFRSALP